MKTQARSLDGSLLEAAQTHGANQRQLLTTVVIPRVLPSRRGGRGVMEARPTEARRSH